MHTKRLWPTTRMVAVAAVLATIIWATVAHSSGQIKVAKADSSLSMLGADISSLQRAEDLGQVYYNTSGNQQDPIQILKDNGVNYARLRIWVNPVSGYNNETKVLEFAKTIKDNGLKLLVDFHYSDTWADPGHQTKPAAWANDNISQLQTDVYNYTYGVCTALRDQGTTPDSVQIGNEINGGMLWPDGQIVNGNYTNLGLLLKAGYNATKACNSGTQVIIHIASGANYYGAKAFFDGIKAQGVQWDITGFSYYAISNWGGGTLSDLTQSISNMTYRYGKPVAVVETGYPFTLNNADFATNSINSSSQLTAGYPATWTGQYDNFRDVLSAARAGGAIGVFYWEPTWVATPGNGWDPTNISGSGDGWDNMTLFNWSAHTNPALGLFKP